MLTNKTKMLYVALSYFYLQKSLLNEKLQKEGLSHTNMIVLVHLYKLLLCKIVEEEQSIKMGHF